MDRQPLNEKELYVGFRHHPRGAARHVSDADRLESSSPRVREVIARRDVDLRTTLSRERNRDRDRGREGRSFDSSERGAAAGSRGSVRIFDRVAEGRGSSEPGIIERRGEDLRRSDEGRRGIDDLRKPEDRRRVDGDHLWPAEEQRRDYGQSRRDDRREDLRNDSFTVCIQGYWLCNIGFEVMTVEQGKGKNN